MTDAITKAAIEEWVQEVFRLNEEYYALIEAASEQALGPPASESAIRLAEEAAGIRFPPSYRMFLSLHDGWTDWEGDERLLSTADFRQGSYFDHVQSMRRFAWENGNGTILEGVIIGACLTSASLLILDKTRIDERGEMEVVNWEHAEVSRHPDLLELLQSTAVDLQQMIEDERREQSGEDTPVDE